MDPRDLQRMCCFDWVAFELIEDPVLSQHHLFEFAIPLSQVDWEIEDLFLIFYPYQPPYLCPYR